MYYALVLLLIFQLPYTYVLGNEGLQFPSDMIPIQLDEIEFHVRTDQDERYSCGKANSRPNELQTSFNNFAMLIRSSTIWGSGFLCRAAL